MKQKISIVLKSLVICGVIAVSISQVALAQAPVAEASSGCTPNWNADLYTDWNYTAGPSEASIVVANHSSSCTYTLSIASYKMYDPSIQTQTLYASNQQTIAPGATVTFTVAVPACNSQVDLFTGSVLQTNPNYSGRNFIEGDQQTNGNYCSNTPPVQISCTANPSSVNEGATVTWTANPTGGNGSFSYSWSGAVTGSSKTEQNSYSTSGTKTATVMVSDNGQTAQATCQTNVVAPPPPPPPTLTGSCTASPTSANEGDTVTWTANPSGGTGTYTYSWMGAVTGSSQTEHDSFSTSGTKTATVEIMSGSQTITKNCSMTVVPPTPTLNTSCSVNPSSTNIGNTVTWTANSTGGTGGYTYSWSGAVTGSNQTEQTSYSSAGTQTATVTVTSGDGQTASNTCSMVVNQPQTPPITVSCSANPSSINVGQNITWNANASGGDGNFSYSWTGSNNLSGSGQTVSESYNNSGSQSATVTVTDNGQTAQATCNATVNQQQTSNLTGSCYANPSSINTGQSINWYATASGGTGSYSYSWTGSNNLTGNGSVVSQTYYNAGGQNATVTITSGNQTVYENCSANVNQPYVPPYVPPYTPPYYPPQNNLYATCTANPSSAYVGQPITWIVNPSGGNGNYSFTWSGSNGFYANGQNVQEVYTTPGQQSATVTVNSNGQTISQTCTVYISPQIVTTLYTPPTPPQSGVYLTQVPYTGSTGTDVKLFVLGLLVWSAGLSYFLVRRKARKAGVTMGQYVSNTIGDTVNQAASKVGSMSPIGSSIMDSNRATQNFLKNAGNSNLTETLESKARDMRAIISAEGLETIVRSSIKNGQYDKNAALSALTKVIDANKTSHYESGDWLTIGGEKVSKALGSDSVSAQNA